MLSQKTIDIAIWGIERLRKDIAKSNPVGKPFYEASRFNMDTEDALKELKKIQYKKVY